MMQATLPRQATPELDLNKLAKQAFQPWADAYETWRSGVEDLVRKPKAKDHACGACKADPCACNCCVSDADLLIEARAGERRIVPIVVENKWRREREVEIELSSWTKLPDGLQVSADLLTPAQFTLAPCGEQQVVLAIDIRSASTDANGQSGRARDVDRCEVAYADLRIKGCAIRPIRIAVAVLPLDCGAYKADCGCECCC
ncbi:MAG TPA: hypothetical protein VF474_14910 [Phenylobacterium sp.]